jgi:hypothetical protein
MISHFIFCSGLLEFYNLKCGFCEALVNCFDIMWCSFLCFRYGNLYLKLAKTSMEKGADYPKNEIQRLEGMLQKVIY